MNHTEMRPSLMLYAGETFLGTLTFREMDWPVTFFTFKPNPEFEKYRAILDVQGHRSVFRENRAAAEKLDLRVIREDGKIIKISSVFIDGDEAVLRPGLIRYDPAEDL